MKTFFDVRRPASCRSAPPTNSFCCCAACGGLRWAAGWPWASDGLVWPMAVAAATACGGAAGEVGAVLAKLLLPPILAPIADCAAPRPFAIASC